VVLNHTSVKTQFKVLSHEESPVIGCGLSSDDVIISDDCLTQFTVKPFSEASIAREATYRCLPCAYLVWPCLEVNPHDKA